MIRYLKRIIHQEEINKFMEDNKEVSSGEFCDLTMDYFHLTVQLKNVENAPKTGGAIFASNHPIGGLDALAVIHKFRNYRDDIKFIVNDILLNMRSLADRFVGVNKHGANTQESLQAVDDLYKSEQAIFVFPAGLVSRKSKGKIRDLEWKKTFITRAKRYNKPIIPVYIDGGLSNFFYRLASIRKFLGIKANIEMLYLGNEQWKQMHKTITITFGDAIDPKTLDRSKTDKQWAEHVKKMVYAMSEK